MNSNDCDYGQTPQNECILDDGLPDRMQIGDAWQTRHPGAIEVTTLDGEIITPIFAYDFHDQSVQMSDVDDYGNPVARDPEKRSFAVRWKRDRQPEEKSAASSNILTI